MIDILRTIVNAHPGWSLVVMFLLGGGFIKVLGDTFLALVNRKMKETE